MPEEQKKFLLSGEDKHLVFLVNTLDSIHDGIVAVDKEGAIIYANPAYTRILGVERERVLGKKMVDIAPEALVLRALLEKTNFVDQASRVVGLGIDVVVSASPVWDQGEVIGAVSIFRDISEVTRLTAELEKARGWAEYLQEELSKKEGLPTEFKQLIGRNSRFVGLLSLAAKVAKTDSTVLIRGESGVGKEVLAKAIHNASKRKDKPLVQVNCAAIPETLLESELFGYEEGAFTGAKRGGKPGKFELANKGTLFLDEIGDLSLGVQAKLLRAIQNKEIERLGGIKTIPTDVRIIAATNQNLEAKIKERTFREDLFYRLNVFPLVIPPLRERKEDILPLANYFLEKFNQQYGKKELAFSNKVTQFFTFYSWPGNIRELQNVVEHAVVVAEGSMIVLNDLPGYLQNVQMEDQASQESKISVDGTTLNLPLLLSQVEKKAIEEALRKAKNNKSEAIRMLGISRAAFYEKLRRYLIG